MPDEAGHDFRREPLVFGRRRFGERDDSEGGMNSMNAFFEQFSFSQSERLHCRLKALRADQSRSVVKRYFAILRKSMQQRQRARKETIEPVNDSDSTLEGRINQRRIAPDSVATRVSPALLQQIASRHVKNKRSQTKIPADY